MLTRQAPRGLQAVAAVLAAVFLFPALYLLWRNATSDDDVAGLLTSSRTLAPLWRTLVLSTLVTLSAGVLGTGLAWLTMRADLPGRRFWRIVLPLPLVMPTFIGAAAFIRTLNPGGLANDLLSSLGVDETPQLQGLFGAWLVLSLFTYPYVYLSVAARLARLPGSLEESARLLGDSAVQAFRRIVLPQIMTAIGAGTLLVFLYTISDFGAVQLMRYDTLTRAIETNYLARTSLAFALSLLLLALAAIVVLGERRFSRDAVSGPTRARQSTTHSLGRWRVPSLAAVVVVAGLAVGAPIVALIEWAAEGLSRSASGQRRLTITRGDVAEASWNTLESSMLAAGLAVLAVLPIAFLVGRYRSRLGTVSHAVVIATFALPGILIALALRFFTIRTAWAGELLTDTRALLVLAYVIRFGSLAMGIVLVAVQSVPQRLHDAASTLGASRLRRLLTIDLRLMAPGLGAAFGLVLLSTMKELPISLIVAPFDYPTLTTKIFQSFEDAFVAEAGLMAIVLVVMSGLLSWLLVLRRADHH